MRKASSFLIFFFFQSILIGQEKYSFQELNSNDGLSNSCIISLYQDSDNLLWIGTFDGLNMYDGKKFYIFNYGRNQNGKAIGNNIIHGIIGDRRNNIWICTSLGVSKYDKKTGNFVNYFYSPDQSNERVWPPLVLMNKKGQLYIVKRFVNKASTLELLNEEGNGFNPVKINIEGVVSKAFFDRDDHLVVLDMDSKVSVYSQVAIDDYRQTFMLNTNKAQNIFKLNGFAYVLYENSQLYKLSTGNKAVQQIIKFPKQVRDIYSYNNNYFVTWKSKGLQVYDSSFKESSAANLGIDYLNDKLVTYINGASENTLWLGTDGNGIIKLEENEKYFHTIFQAKSVFSRAVRAFCEVNGELWLGTKGDGIIVFPFPKDNDELAEPYLRKYYSSRRSPYNSVYTIKKSNNNNLVYIGSDGEGITMFDRKSKKQIQWDEIKGTERFKTFTSVYAISEDKDGSLWLGTSGYGLIHLKISLLDGHYTLQFLEQYTVNNTENGPPSNVIYSLEDNGDILFVGGRNGGGLCLLDKKARKFRSINAYSSNDGLSHNDVLFLFRDNKNRLWVGTSYGLNWIDVKDLKNDYPVFNKLTTSEGLPNNTIHSIIEDNKGFIWISTNNGLARINPDSRQVIRFHQEDGLQSNEFSDGAVWKDDFGKIFFGGINGFNYFLPESIKLTEWRPNLLISGLKIGASDFSQSQIVLKPSQGDRDVEKYTISRNNNFLELQLKPITFSNANKHIVSYILVGHDKEWRIANHSEGISYNNLSPGNYILKVKWLNGKGAWSKEVTAFKLTVQQFFWLTLPAIILYIVAFLIIVYGFVRYRQNRFKLKQELKTETLLHQKDKELNKEKLSFFTNIAHELQTPITLIIGAIERYEHKSELTLRKKEKSYYLSLIHQQSSRLTYLIHQLIDFRKAESGHLKSEGCFLNLSELLLNIVNLFDPLCIQKRLDFKWNIESNIKLWIDKDKLEKVVFNLLSNAFKHSEVDSCVMFNLKQDLQRKTILIEVFNSKSYLSKEQLAKIFDIFYVTDSTRKKHQGSGIGLAFTSQLVAVMEGKIDVESNNEGVLFTVNFPFNLPPQNFEVFGEHTSSPGIPSSLIRSVTSLPKSDTLNHLTEENKKSLIHNLAHNRQSILIVEDDIDIRYLLKDIFQETYIVYEVENGKDALDFLVKIQPDLIISDIMMPSMSGLDLCSRVKDTPNTCHIPFILLSARGTIENQTEGYELGADAYIPKPFHTAHLLVRVSKLLEHQKKLHDIFRKGTLASFIDSEKLTVSDKDFLTKIHAIIAENLANDELTATLIETKLCLSKMQLYRRLKTMANMTPNEFIKLVRLQSAARFLQQTNFSVSEIFYKTGFNNQSYFFREFKKMYGCSPNEYRSNQNISVEID